MARTPTPDTTDPLKYSYLDGPLCDCRIDNQPWPVRVKGVRARLLLAIHMHSGSDAHKLCAAAGLALVYAHKPIAALVRWGLVRQHGREVHITSLGSIAAQRVLRVFLLAQRRAGRARALTKAPSTTGDSTNGRPKEVAA